MKLSIQKSKQGSYRVRWYDAFNRQCSKTFRRKVDAEVWEGQKRIERSKGEIPRGLQSFGVFSAYWLKSYGEVHHAISTQVRFSQIINQYLKPRFDHMEIGQIGFLHCSEFQTHLCRLKLSAKSINTMMSLLRKMFSDAVAWGFLDKNPAERLRSLRVQQKEILFWSFDERDRFLQLAKQRNARLHFAVAMAVFTGLRSGELMGLKRDCLDFDRREILVKRNFCKASKGIVDQTKSKLNRRIPMNDFVYELLLPFRTSKPDERICAYGLRQLDNMRAFKSLCRKASVTVIRWHDLRHTFASHLVMRGVPLAQVKSLLGHSTIAMTEKYAHLMPDTNRGVTNMILPLAGRLEDKAM